MIRASMSRLARCPALAAMVSAVAVVSAGAQNARTFVSANGLDTNSCTRTAPCRTLAGAFAKTNAGGEINVLDPAGYGTLVINKAISIVNDGVGSAEILVPAGGTGITIDAGENDVVHLRGLTIEGAGIGDRGIRFNTGKSLGIENCVIRHMVFDGVDLAPTGSSSFSVSDTLVSDNGGGSFDLTPSGSGAVTLVFNRVEMLNNVSFGLLARGNFSTISGSVKATVTDSVVTNTNTGFYVTTGVGGAPTELMLVNSVVFNNVTGIFSFGPGARVRLNQTTVAGNAQGWTISSGGVVESYGHNYINGNGGAEGAPPAIPSK